MKCKHHLNGECFCANQEIIDDCPNHLPYGECALDCGQDEFEYIDNLIDSRDN